MQYDVIIVGAGPAGLSAAKILAENNKKVLVLEKNKIIGQKVCAGGLTVKDFDLGIDKKIAESFFSKVIIHTPLATDIIKQKKPFVATVDREKLGKYMAKQAEKVDAKIIIGDEVIEIGEDFVKTKSEKKYNFKFLIGADGSNSKVRDYLGLKKDKEAIAFHYKIRGGYFKDLEIFFDGFLFGSGYAWIFPHKEFTSIGCGADPKMLLNSEELQNGFQKWFNDYFKGKYKLRNEDREAWMINYDYRGYKFGNIFLIGDAGGFPSGITGEGMYFAMVSGIDVAKKILNPNYITDNISHILKIKESQEKYLSPLSISRPLTQIDYDMLGLVLKSKIIDRKLVESFF
jgi:geranylgeranyl reductase